MPGPGGLPACAAQRTDSPGSPAGPEQRHGGQSGTWAQGAGRRGAGTPHYARQPGAGSSPWGLLAAALDVPQASDAQWPEGGEGWALKEPCTRRAAHSHTPYQFRKDTAPQRKEFRKQSVAVLRLQGRERGLRGSIISHSQRQELTARWVSRREPPQGGPCPTHCPFPARRAVVAVAAPDPRALPAASLGPQISQGLAVDRGHAGAVHPPYCPKRDRDSGKQLLLPPSPREPAAGWGARPRWSLLGPAEGRVPAPLQYRGVPGCPSQLGQGVPGQV